MKKEDVQRYEVFCGIDVGKTAHFMVARDVRGTKLAQGSINQDEADIARALLQASRKGRVLVVVDQPGSFGSLLVAVALNMGLDVACVPPKDFHDLAKLYRTVNRYLFTVLFTRCSQQKIRLHVNGGLTADAPPVQPAPPNCPNQPAPRTTHVAPPAPPQVVILSEAQSAQPKDLAHKSAQPAGTASPAPPTTRT